jgi:hypothetical protein
MEPTAVLASETSRGKAPSCHETDESVHPTPGFS